MGNTTNTIFQSFHIYLLHFWTTKKNPTLSPQYFKKVNDKIWLLFKFNRKFMIKNRDNKDK